MNLSLVEQEELLAIKEKFERLKKSRKAAVLRYQKKNAEKINAMVLKRYHEVYKKDPIFQEKIKAYSIVRKERKEKKKEEVFFSDCQEN